MSKYKYRESWDRGQSTEERFRRCCEAKNIDHQKSEFHEDVNHHFDCILANSIRVDVKGRKRRKRSDTEMDDDIIYVELMNVKGNRGWLYGKADYFAFERLEGFVMVKKDDLIPLVERLVKDDFKSYPTLYYMYRRKNRPDEAVTLISYEDLLTIPHIFLEDKES